MLTASITDWILSLDSVWVIAIVFVGAALESAAFVGLVYPGDITLIIGGALAYQGRVSLSAVIVAAALGAIVGDNIAFSVGKRWGEKLLRAIWRRIPSLRDRADDHIERAREFIEHRGGAAVFLGRFTTALRAVVPLLAGIGEMRYRTFLAFNVLGGVAWGTAAVLLGFFAGAAWERVSHYASWAGTALLLLIVLGYIAFRVVRRFRGRDRSRSRA